MPAMVPQGDTSSQNRACSCCEFSVDRMKFTAARVARARVLGLAAGLPGVLLSQVLRRDRRRKLPLVVAGVTVAVVVLVAAAAQWPIVIADTASAWVFGARHDPLGRPIPQLCAPVPSPSVSLAPVVPGGEEGQPPLGHAAPVPGPGFDADGHLTVEALSAVELVPVDTDIATAQGWVLFRLAHPPGELSHSATGDFAAFADWYAQTAGLLSDEASPLDVVTSIDPAADYAPYLLLSQAAVYRMLKQRSVRFTEEQRGDLIAALSRTCRGAPVGGLPG